MITFFSSWAKGIVVAVVISTIIELVLPSGSQKKYIKVVLGVFILFTIISPIIDKVSNNKLDVNQIFNTKAGEDKIEKVEETIAKKLESSNSRSIKDIYVSNLENDIKIKLNEKGYEVNSIYIRVKDDENYTIESVELSIKKNKEENKNTNIEKIEINVQVGAKNNVQNQISKLEKSEIEEIKEILSKNYEINEDKVEIN